jgi:hypothetical protein
VKPGNTFMIKVRGTNSGLMAAEYMCPEHGRFDLTVTRDANGDPPAVQPCDVITGEADLRDQPGEMHPILCGKPSEYVISAPLGRIKRGEVTRGKADEKPTPFALDTEALADGMPLKEWKERRAKMWRAKDYAEFKKNVG